MKDEEIRDYIKKEAEHIPVPDSLAPERIKEKLSPARQAHQKNRRRLRTIAAAAACLLLLAIAGAAAIPALVRQDPTDQTQMASTGSKESDVAEEADSKGTAGEETAAYTGISYKEVCEQINSYNSELYEERIANERDGIAVENDATESEASMENSGVEDSHTKSSATTPKKQLMENSRDSASDFSETDTQVADVMEGDIVKTDGQYIYTVQEGVYGFKISIYRAEGESVKHITKLKVENQNCSEMYLEDNKLIAIGDQWDSSSKDEQRQEEETGITLFDIRDPQNPKQLRTLTQSGSYSTSRISDGYLYTFSEYQVSGMDYSPDDPDRYIPRADKNLIPESALHPLGGVSSNCYMVMSSLALNGGDDFSDTDKIEFQNVSAAFGDASVYYMSNNNIYIAAPSKNLRTNIVKYCYEDGKFEKKANREIRGQIANSYYFHEYEGCLAFVYTRQKNSGSTTNGLCTLDENLKPLGEIADLGIDERIYSSYYIDNMAYFVTYRETDPVFAVDIKNPEKPSLKSELKLPGFSSYLHSFGDDLLLGIGEGDVKTKYGYFDSGVKLSLFSIKNPEKLREVMKKILDAGTHSIAEYNHKAVFVDEERKLIGLGVDSYYSGARPRYILYRYEDGKLKELYRKKISSLADTRGIRIGNFFYVADTGKNKISCFPL